MKTAHSFFRRTASLLAAAFLLAGCLQDKLVWSPDGSRAAVITGEGLYLSSAAGALTPLLLPQVYRAAWLPDSRGLVVARTRPIREFRDLALALGPARTRALTLKAESIWREWEASPDSDSKTPPIKPDSDGSGIALYLKDHHRERLKEKLGSQWAEIESLAADWHSLTVARLVGDTLQLEATLHEGLSKVNEIRPAPDGRSIAFVTQSELSPDSDESLQLFLSPVAGASPAKLIASQTSGFPDWAADGRTLLCFKRAPSTPGSGGLRLGMLTAFQVLDADGRIEDEVTSTDLAGLIFHDGSRIRGLRDGRVLFNAVEFNLPLAANENESRDEFFVMDPKGHTVSRLVPKDTFTALPKSLTHFEPSPDERQILVSDDSGKVWLVTLADRKVEQICAGFGKEDSIAPAWRQAGEFTYRQASAPRHDLIQHHDGGETVFSRTWPEAVLARLVK